MADITLAFPVWLICMAMVHYHVYAALRSAFGIATRNASGLGNGDIDKKTDGDKLKQTDEKASQLTLPESNRKWHVVEVVAVTRAYAVGAVLLLVSFTYGHAMHWTANAINTYMTEYNLEKGLRDKVDDEVYVAEMTPVLVLVLVFVLALALAFAFAFAFALA